MSVNWLPFGCCVRLQRAQRWRRRGGARIEVRGESEELRNSFIILFSPRHASCLLRLLGSGMEETVWEQYTVTLQRDAKMGFGIAVSGGRDNPNVETGETSIIVSDVLPGGPADGLLFENDRVIQVNTIAMDNVPHSFAVQSLRKCGKVAKITVKRPRKVAVLKRPPSPSADSRDYNISSYYPEDNRSVHSDPDSDYPRGNGGLGYPRDRERDRSLEKSRIDYLEPDYRSQDYDSRRDWSRGRSAERSPSSDSGYRRDGSRGRTLERGSSPEPRYHRQHSRGRGGGGSPAGSYGRDQGYDTRRYDTRSDDRMVRSHSRDRLQDHSPSPSRERDRGKDRSNYEPLEPPINVMLVKNRPNEEYGLRLGSQIFIKEMTSTGLAARDGNLQEGDIILKSLVVEFAGTAVRAGDDPLSHRLHPRFAVWAEEDDYGSEKHELTGNYKLVWKLCGQFFTGSISDWSKQHNRPSESRYGRRQGLQSGFHSRAPTFSQHHPLIGRKAGGDARRTFLSALPHIFLLGCPLTTLSALLRSHLLLLGMMPFSSSWLSLPKRMASQFPSLPSYKVSTTLKISPREKAPNELQPLTAPDLAFPRDTHTEKRWSKRNRDRDSERDFTLCQNGHDLTPRDLQQEQHGLLSHNAPKWIRAAADCLFLMNMEELTERMIMRQRKREKDCRGIQPSVGVVGVLLPVVLLFPPGLEVAPLEFCKERTAYLQAVLTWCSLVLRHWKSVRRGQIGVTFGHLERHKAYGDSFSKSVEYIHEVEVHEAVPPCSTRQADAFFLDGTEGDLDVHDDRMSYLSAMSADYLSMDSRLTSDYDDTADEGGTYTDNEADEPLDRQRVSAISRSSEPVMPEEILRKSSPEIRGRIRRVGSREMLTEASPPIMSTFLPDPAKVKMLSQVEVSRAQYDPSRNYDSRSSSPASSEHPRSQDSPAKTKPPPPPTALKPTYVSRSSRGLVNSPPIRDSEHLGNSPDDPSQRSFLGKVKAFEQMDHVARTQRVMEIQEAQNARVEIAQKHPDIYAVPMKSQKLDHSRPQPIGSSARPEPQTPPSKLPYKESRPLGLGEEPGDEFRHQLAEQTKRGYYNTTQKYQDTEL
ncbi:tight junction protein ZO-2b [Garra rufa]|uniref:tight junction protein ZO-2b n=1 Tax=Garra rufa TaxID=137080 RepID=UPI003CCEEC83